MRREEEPLLIAGHRIQTSPTQDTIVIDQCHLHLSRVQFLILRVLLQHAGQAVSFETLGEAIGNETSALTDTCRTSPSWRRTLYDRIYDVKSLLWPHHLDIVNLRGHGYLLLPLREHAEADALHHR